MVSDSQAPVNPVMEGMAMPVRSAKTPRGPVAGLSTAEIVVLGVCASVVLYLGWQPAPGLADVLSVWVN